MTFSNFKKYLEDVKKNKSGAFSLVEILIVISIMGGLASVIVGSVNISREKTIFAKAKKDLQSVAQALEIYAIDNGGYPPDAARGLPSGIEQYLPSDTWPVGAWTGSVFDWDNWTDPETGKPIYQISIRFCPAGGPISECQFPPETWAEDFDINSAMYYCVQGACRAHLSEAVDYPGYCINCDSTGGNQ